MPEDRDALIQHHTAMRAAMQSAIDGLTPEQAAEPSIDGWSVKDHLLHLATWDDIRASEIERISAGLDSAWRMTDEQDAVFNDMAYELRRDLSVEQAYAEFQRSGERLFAALNAITPRGLDASLYGEAGLVTRHSGEHAEWVRRWREERGY